MVLQHFIIDTKDSKLGLLGFITSCAHSDSYEKDNINSVLLCFRSCLCQRPWKILLDMRTSSQFYCEDVELLHGSDEIISLVQANDCLACPWADLL